MADPVAAVRTPARTVVPAAVVAWWAVTSLLATVTVLVVALSLGSGASQPAGPGLADPGSLTTWGLPAVRLLCDATGIATIGLLCAAVFLLPSPNGELTGLCLRACRAASRIALVWSVAALLQLVLTVSEAFAEPVPAVLNRPLLGGFVHETVLGQALVAQSLLALAVFGLGGWTLGVKGGAVLLGLAVAAVVSPILAGHSSTSGYHDVAVTSLALHVVAASVWVGGLLALGWISWHGSRRLWEGVTRFSALAAWCLAIVIASGVVNAAAGLGSLSALVTTPYGFLVLVKASAAGTLAGLGWMHRRRLLPGLRRLAESDSRGTANRAFLRLAAIELSVMAVALAVAVALSQTPDVAGDVPISSSAELLGTSMPSPPSFVRLLTGFYPDGVGLALVALAAALYVRGLLVLRRRGDRWPPGRTAAWFAGLAIVGWATFGGLGLYSHVLFSAHMVTHMLLSMVAPIPLVLAAPVTLALRTLPGPRRPGELGPRQLLLSLLHSRLAQVLTHPVVASAFFVGSLYGIYFSGWFETLMLSHTGHMVMTLHFLLVGSLFFYVIIGIDPAPRRVPPLLRFGVLLFTLPFHAFFAVTVMSSSTVIGAGYWALVDRPYRVDLLADQNLGGGISWAMGELPLVIVLAALFVQWIRTDRREAARLDRTAARTVSTTNEDEALEQYNAYLARLGDWDQRQRDGSARP